MTTAIRSGRGLLKPLALLGVLATLFLLGSASAFHAPDLTVIGPDPGG